MYAHHRGEKEPLRATQRESGMKPKTKKEQRAVAAEHDDEDGDKVVRRTKGLDQGAKR